MWLRSANFRDLATGGVHVRERHFAIAAENCQHIDEALALPTDHVPIDLEYAPDDDGVRILLAG